MASAGNGSMITSNRQLISRRTRMRSSAAQSLTASVSLKYQLFVDSQSLDRFPSGATTQPGYFALSNRHRSVTLATSSLVVRVVGGRPKLTGIAVPLSSTGGSPDVRRGDRLFRSGQSPSQDSRPANRLPRNH